MNKDQVALKFDMQPDTIQTDHIAAVFLITTIFSTDYWYHMQGIFSNQLLRNHNK